MGQRNPFKLPRMTKRPQNFCKRCGYTWYPRGKSISPKCPQCGSTETAIGCGGCATLIVLALLLGAASVAFVFAG
jgi:predicted RNA-binding Zn-ribbon protein involved in translation (DUF1610 family)